MKTLGRALAFWLALLAVTRPSLSAAPRKPNVVVFLADDAGWGDYSFSGNRQVRTPNIDRIAQRGVSLDRFYVCPVCSPTRAEFLTGRYHLRSGVRGVSEGQERLDLREKTVADAFQRAGYATGAFGKWHNGSQWPYHPMARGFEEYFGHTSGHWGEYFDAPLEDRGRMVRTQGYIVDVCTDRALDFIERNKEKPFLCYVPFTTPHSPWAAPEADWRRLQGRPIEQRATAVASENLDQTRCALAMVENQDWNVGRLLTRIRELGLEENTIVLYFSDNGPNSARWNGGMRGQKGSVDEGGVRSVCYLAWPAKIAAGQLVEPIAGAIDLLPTLTGLAGVAPVGSLPLDGRDLSPLLLKQTPAWPDRVLFSTWAGKVSARTQTHRLDAEGRLYEMTSDPGQTQPVNERESEVASKLTAAVKAFRTEMNLEDPLAPAAKKGDRSDRSEKSRVDARPIPVGYREFPVTLLPARDGEPQGGVRRSSKAPNCSYFVNWTRLEDRMVWRLSVHTSGRYEVSIDYTCPMADAGSTVELAFNGSRLSGKVAPGWDPPLYTNQDTLPRSHGESAMKEFRTLTLGEMDLKAGEGQLTLRAVEIPGAAVMDVRRVTLTLLEPKG